MGVFNVTKIDFLDPRTNPTDDDGRGCFDEHPILSPPERKNPQVPCPLCKGHGGWVLRFDAYGPGQHFKSHCGQCNGWGYVDKGSKDESCIHEMREVRYEECMERGIKHYGMCWHVQECTKCGNISAYDSSG